MTRWGIRDVELEHRHQFNRGDSQVSEVGNFFNQSRVGAGLFDCQARTGMPSEAANVQFIDYSFHEWALKRLVTLPVVGARVGNDTFHRRGYTVALPAVCLRHGDSPAVRIKQNLVAIEAQAQFGLERTDGSIAIELARHQAGNKDVPVV